MIGCRPLDDDEISELLIALGSTQSGARDQTLAILGITTGFRISELLSLRIRDLTTNGNLNAYIRIPASRMKGKKRPRSAQLAPRAIPYVEAWLAELNDRRLDGGNRPLFPGRKHGNAITRVQAHRIMRDAFQHAGIEGAQGELSTHTLRKTFAAKMWEAHGQNIWKVQNALGHASPASTVAYLSFEDSEQAAAVESAFGAASVPKIPRMPMPTNTTDADTPIARSTSPLIIPTLSPCRFVDNSP
jgi:integrase